MKKRKEGIAVFFACICMITLILDSPNVLQTARDSIAMCLKTLIPTLFPLLFISMWINNSLIGRKISLLTPLAKLCGIPEGAESILIPAFLGGYPVGAQIIQNSLDEKSIDTFTAKRLLSFCNNAGPAFIFGVFGNIYNLKIAAMLWGIHIISTITVAILVPRGMSVSQNILQRKLLPVSQILNRAIKTMTLICGWTILFSILSTEIIHFCCPLAKSTLQIAIKGLLELSHGCISLSVAPISTTSFVLASMMLSFGGLCVYVQTVSITGSLGAQFYLLGRLLHSCISGICSSVLGLFILPSDDSGTQTILFAGLCIFATALLYFCLKRKITVAFLKNT